jgi:O-methyltransferase involved in polyketide biosynthesis
VAGPQRIELGDVQETLLIPLYARALETRKPASLIGDEKAVEIVESLDYDFARFGRGPSMAGCVIRGAIFDEWVSRFLREHPGGTVVEIGAGLNTRYERLDNGSAHWVELDLPDSMALRRRFFSETERRVMVEGSVVSDAWVASVTSRPAPYFFVAEAVLPYLPENDVRTALATIAGVRGARSVAFDTAAARMVRTQDHHDTLKKVSGRMQWACDDPRLVERWDLGPSARLGLAESRTLGQVERGFLRTAPLRQRVMPTVVGVMSRLGGYRLNRYTIARGGARRTSS